MSLNLPSRRLLRAAAPLTKPLLPYTFLVPSYTQRRTLLGLQDSFTKAINYFRPNKGGKNPLTEEFLKKRAERRRATQRGDLASSSIFEDEETAGEKGKPDQPKRAIPRNPYTMAAALDPQPRNRIQWQRRKVIQEVKKRGRLSKTQALKRQERMLLAKSHDFKTSYKKLVPIAKQIAGKTVDDAIIQMRFSRKKVAKDVKEHLEHARNEAIAKRGMGLGVEEGKSFAPKTIVTKDGKRVKVQDPTTLYVDEAWVGKGLYRKSYDFRARGKIGILLHRTTSLSVVLKEEATRIRLHEEREQKAKNKKVWVQLPNRPVTAQGQYYSW
ncbi:mitochondrial large ribosomal subunit protein [Rutstroemia sp. NJR-2017a BBW]|nr:mitochondrial large ribosomal subunit protein [Rutstroemia sp. NJR-2017a BBW]